MGYKFQFVTLAGFHSLNHGMFELASGYRDRGMAAYSELQQAEFASEAGRLHRHPPPARGRHRLFRRWSRSRLAGGEASTVGARRIDRSRPVHAARQPEEKRHDDSAIGSSAANISDCRVRRRSSPAPRRWSGPFEDERKARNEWMRLTYCRDRLGATTRYCDRRRGAVIAVSSVVDRPRAAARAQPVARRRRDPDRRGARPSSPSCTAASTAAARSCSQRGPSGSRRSTPASCPISCPRPREIRDGDWTVGADPRRPAGPPRRDHRPDRPQDGDQRAQFAARRCSWPISRTRPRRPGPI